MINATKLIIVAEIAKKSTWTILKQHKTFTALIPIQSKVSSKAGLFSVVGGLGLVRGLGLVPVVGGRGRFVGWGKRNGK